MSKRLRTGVRRLVPVAAGTVLAGLLTCGSPSYAASTSGPDYEMPFACGDLWNGGTRYNHSPSALAIDWNRPDDLGAMLVSVAPGVVTSVVNLGDRSYGRYIVVDHGGGHSTLYAHLSAFWSTVGQVVDQGTPLGQVGTSGGSTGPHLHYEQRLNRQDQQAYFNRKTFVMGTTLASRNCGDVPVIGDWDGNGTSNIGIQRRGTSPKFYLKRPGQKSLGQTFGWRTDQPLSGDWNGNGTIEIGVRRPGLKAFVLRNENGTTRQVSLGSLSDFGITGDWNGDKSTDLGVWHPNTRVFTLRAANGSTRTVTFGSLGDRPVTGDWNADGITDLGVHSQRTSTFTLRTVTRSGAVSTRKVVWGSPTSLPVAGDWNGDGAGDVGVWDPATAIFSLRLSPTDSQAAATIRTPRYGVPRG